MVSFTCNNCQDVVKKPKVPNHANSCGSHSFTCVDCMHVFDLDTIKSHTSCVTEEDKYQGKWKQKLNNNNDAPRGIERPPRAPMNDLSSSDDDDDAWVQKSGSKKSTAAPRVAKPASAAAQKSRKHPRPGVSPSSDDDDDGESHSAHVQGKVNGAKRAKTGARSPSSTPKTRPAPTKAVRSPPSSSLGPKVSKAPTPAHLHDNNAAEDAVHVLKKDTPLLLPRSTTSTECIVPSFVLGTSDEVADIVRDVLAEKGVAALRSKDVAAELVERYAKRIAKSVRHAVDTAVELGALQLDKKGNITIA